MKELLKGHNGTNGAATSSPEKGLVLPSGQLVIPVREHDVFSESGLLLPNRARPLTVAEPLIETNGHKPDLVTRTPGEVRIFFDSGREAETAEINRQVDILLNHFPESPKPAKTETGEKQHRPPIVIAGNWHPEAVEIAKELAVRKVVEKFFETSQTHRLYKPDEVRARTVELIRLTSGKLSDKTVALWEKFIDTELRTSDYVEAGLRTIKGDQARARQMMLWGTQESGHPLLLLNALEDAGLITPRERLEWEKRASEEQWHVENHRDLVKDYFYLAYATYQEYQTFKNYGKFIRSIVTDLFLEGYSKEAIQHELKKYKIGADNQPGLLEPTSIVYAEEAAHFAMYLELTKTLLKYIPATMLEAIVKTQIGFQMPGYDRNPEIMAEIVEALYGTPRDVVLSYIETFNDVCRRLGFADRNAVKHAERNSQQLREGPARFVIYHSNGEREDLPIAA